MLPTHSYSIWYLSYLYPLQSIQTYPALGTSWGPLDAVRLAMHWFFGYCSAMISGDLFWECNNDISAASTVSTPPSITVYKHPFYVSMIGSVTIWNWYSWLRMIRCCVQVFGWGLIAMPYPRTWLGTQHSQANGRKKRDEPRVKSFAVFVKVQRWQGTTT